MIALVVLAFDHRAGLHLDRHLAASTGWWKWYSPTRPAVVINGGKPTLQLPDLARR